MYLLGLPRLWWTGGYRSYVLWVQIPPMLRDEVDRRSPPASLGEPQGYRNTPQTNPVYVHVFSASNVLRQMSHVDQSEGGAA